MAWLKNLFASAPHWREHRLTLSNFVYRRDKINEYRAWTSIDKTFFGDCEDYAFTLQNQIGGQVHVVFPEGVSGGHAVLIKDGWVYDNRYKHCCRVEKFKGIVTDEQLVYKGEYRVN